MGGERGRNSGSSLSLPPEVQRDSQFHKFHGRALNSNASIGVEKFAGPKGDHRVDRTRMRNTCASVCTHRRTRASVYVCVPCVEKGAAERR